MKRIIKIGIIITIAILLILFVPLPFCVDFSNAGFHLTEITSKNDNTEQELGMEREIFVTVRGRNWRSLTGFNRITGTVEIKYNDESENMLLYEFFDSRMVIAGDIFWNGLHRFDPNRNRFEFANVFFTQSHDVFAIVVSRGDNIIYEVGEFSTMSRPSSHTRSYYVASSDTSKTALEILELIRIHIWI
ncbi:MAG: hypothetical protein FWD01_00980 [Defluviitaleaceae bacterium]|nr:hypothetical protein [Defluviitaleaceae bacterium]